MEAAFCANFLVLVLGAAGVAGLTSVEVVGAGFSGSTADLSSTSISSSEKKLSLENFSSALCHTFG